MTLFELLPDGTFIFADASVNRAVKVRLSRLQLEKLHFRVLKILLTDPPPGRESQTLIAGVPIPT
jgi:hypothetical protein